MAERKSSCNQIPARLQSPLGRQVFWKYPYFHGLITVQFCVQEPIKLSHTVSSAASWEGFFHDSFYFIFFYLLWFVRRNINAGCDYSGQTATCCLIWFKWNPFVNRLPLCSINRISTETRQTWTELVHMVHPVHFRDVFGAFFRLCPHVYVVIFIHVF